MSVASKLLLLTRSTGQDRRDGRELCFGGQGGIGIVFRARGEQLDCELALKILASGTLSDEPSREQFRTEALGSKA